MKYLQHLIITVTLALIGLKSEPVKCQIIEFEAASDKKNYAINEQIKITFTVNEKGENFEAPDFKDFEKVSGPNTSKSVSIVNGETTVKNGYTYILRAKGSGAFSIPPAKIEVDGNKYESNKLTIHVSADSALVSVNTERFNINENDLFVELTLNKEKVRLNEVVIASYRLYSTFESNHIQDWNFKIPENMWVEDIVHEEVLTEHHEKKLHNKTYKVYLLKTELWYPLKEGQAPVLPFSVSVRIDKKIKTPVSKSKSGGIFDDFFGSYEMVDTVVTISSDGLTLNVLPDDSGDIQSPSKEEILALFNSSKQEKISASTPHVLFLVDVSGSMMCKDFSPSRLEAIQTFLRAFVKNRKNKKIGIASFANNVIINHDFTSDATALNKAIHELKINTENDGTAIGMAIYAAVNQLKNVDGEKTVVLITDGLNNAGNIAPLTVAELAQKFHIQFLVLGIGASGQAQCPFTKGNEIIFDTKKIIIDENLLENIALKTNGSYLRILNEKELLKSLEKL